MSVLLVAVFLIIEINAKFPISSACYKNEHALLKYIKPTADGSIIPVICSKGFTMIDIGLNIELITEYFSSFQEYNALEDNEDYQPLAYGPGCNDWVSWRDFWIPATANTKFRVANLCEDCLTSTFPEYDENVAYHMTNFFFVLGKIRVDECARDEFKEPINYAYDPNDRTTSMCNICDYGGSVIKSSTNWTECPALQLSADTITDHSNHDKSLLDTYILVQPSVAGDRSYCTCYQPPDAEITTYMVSKHELPHVSFGYKDYISSWTVDAHIIWGDDKSEATDCSTKYYLSNTDFMDGTLKIKFCGEYILTEDISVSFNAPSAEVQASGDFSPNSIDVEDLYWYPTTAQQENDKYPGLDIFHGTYQFGFFSAISIQMDDVTINLNGFKIEMEMKYYLQQRFFSIVQLGNRNFIKDQGPAQDLGKVFVQISNFVIKDGSIGRVSHHGIHGNSATNVLISNVKISNFDIAGIHLNGCTSVRITDVVVGPQSSEIPVVGRYLHARALLPRLRYFVDGFGDEVIPFGDKNTHKESKSVSELAENIITQMDLIYFNIINGEVHDEHDVNWIAAQSLFLNKDGWLDAGSAYGILINGHGTAVTSLGRRHDESSDITVKNVEIFGISISAEERFYATVEGYDRKLQGFFFDTIDWVSITHSDDGRYIGDAYTDLVFAANELMKTEFCFLNTLFVTPVREWVFSDDLTIEVVQEGGSDVQSHDAKGVIGLRIDQTEEFKAVNVYIHDITNYGVLANTECCGEWSMITFLHHTYIDIEPGYTGTRAHGALADFMDGSYIDIVIENIESHYGSAIGMSFYKGSEIGKLANVEITNVNAGSKMTKKEALALTLPNMVPFVCSVEFGVNTDDPDLNPISIKHMDEDSIVGRNINGYDTCEDERLVGSIVKAQNIIKNSNVTGIMLYINYFWIPVLFVVLFISVMIYYFRCRMNRNVKEKLKSYGAINFHSDI